MCVRSDRHGASLFIPQHSPLAQKLGSGASFVFSGVSCFLTLLVLYRIRTPGISRLLVSSIRLFLAGVLLLTGRPIKMHDTLRACSSLHSPCLLQNGYRFACLFNTRMTPEGESLLVAFDTVTSVHAA